MTMLDLSLCFTQASNALSPFAPTATGQNLSPYYIDRLATMDDGPGADVTFKGVITTALTSGGAATVNYQVLGNATDPTFASGNIVMAQTGVLGYATFVAGYQWDLLFSPENYAEYLGVFGLPRYYTLNVQIATAVLTAGALNAWLSPKTPQSNLAYKSGYTV